MNTEKEKQFLRALAAVLDTYNVALCARKDNLVFMFESAEPAERSKIFTGRNHSTAYEISLIERKL